MKIPDQMLIIPDKEPGVFTKCHVHLGKRQGKSQPRLCCHLRRHLTRVFDSVFAFRLRQGADSYRKWHIRLRSGNDLRLSSATMS